MRVDEGYYLVTFNKHNYVLGERVLPTHTKCVKSKGKRYCYTYLRIPLPWSSLFNYRRVELTIKIYKLQEKDNKLEYRRYLYDKTVYSLNNKEREQLEHEHLMYNDYDGYDYNEEETIELDL